MIRVIIFAVALITLTGTILFMLKEQNSKESPTTQTQRTNQTTQAVNISASFAIFTNSTFRVFTDSRYHNLSEDVFIDPKNPNTVEIRKNGTTWGDFFKTLPMELTKECLTTGTGQSFCNKENENLKLYINSIEEKDALFKEIKEGDRLLVSYGDENQEQIEAQLSQIPEN